MSQIAEGQKISSNPQDQDVEMRSESPSSMKRSSCSSNEDASTSSRKKRRRSKEKKKGMRRGKWIPEEEAYAKRITLDFKAGVLPLKDGTTLRCFLAERLKCDPMRISKKFSGAFAVGKQVYKRAESPQFPELMTTAVRELALLEQDLLYVLNSSDDASTHIEMYFSMPGGPPLPCNSAFREISAKMNGDMSTSPSSVMQFGSYHGGFDGSKWSNSKVQTHAQMQMPMGGPPHAAHNGVDMQMFEQHAATDSEHTRDRSMSLEFLNQAIPYRKSFQETDISSVFDHDMQFLGFFGESMQVM